MERVSDHSANQITCCLLAVEENMDKILDLYKEGGADLTVAGSMGRVCFLRLRSRTYCLPFFDMHRPGTTALGWRHLALKASILALTGVQSLLLTT